MEILLASFIQPLMQGAYDMQTLMDIFYVLTTTVFGFLFTAITFFLYRILKQFDAAIKELKQLSDRTIKNETIIDIHVNDKIIHDFSRRQADV